MLVTEHVDRRNRFQARALAGGSAVLSVVLGWLLSPWFLVLALIGVALAWWWRRKCVRRRWVMGQPFPEAWEKTLRRDVTFFNALDESGKNRFRDLVKVFLDEVRITGVRTEVDETTRALIGASAVIPIFGFEDWEYAGLGEVLVYPGTFNDQYQTDDQAAERNTLGMIGVNHLSGVMILSKPSLVAGFRNDGDKRNVGIHEFSHLVDKRDGEVDGVPADMPADVYDPWVQWVGREIRGDGRPKQHINDYAYTNDAEYFAVLSEYFFERPELLQQKEPKLYAMLEKMYRQDPGQLLATIPKKRGRVGRNEPCPCGSGDKYKRCCRSNSAKGMPR